MTQIAMTPAQQSAVEAIRNWHQRGTSPIFTLFGYAGTGKTTVVAKAVSEMGLRAVYGAYTGKAASVMRAQGIPAQTIHSMIYFAEQSKLDPKVVKFHWDPDSVAGYSDIIVIDECSMVGDRVGRDLLKYNVKILALGDPAQLPPVEGGGFFTNRRPDVTLTDVHRQAAGSPVLAMATDTRMGKKLNLGKYGDSEVVEARDLEDDDIWSADQVLVGTNRSRRALNARARSHFGMTGPYPQMGEKVVCLRNNYERNMMNGEMFIVVSCVEENPIWLKMDLVRADNTEEVISEVRVPTNCFIGKTDESSYPSSTFVTLDYGYALTVHKSQGSQWDNVVLLDESRVFRDDARRWLYTGITRASKKITIAKGRL